MRNPYFFVLLLSVLSGVSSQSAFAQATSKLTTSSNEVIPVAKSTANKKTTAVSKNAPTKISVDLSTVPALPGYDPSITEAGVNAPGIVSAPSQISPYAAANQVYTGSSSPENVMMTTAGGLLQLFSMASLVGARANPAAGIGPMFKNECIACKNKEEINSSLPKSLAAHVVTPSDDSFNDRDGIKSIFQNETFQPFAETLDLQESFVDASLSSILNFNALIISNPDEFQSLCDNHGNLNNTEKAAFLTYLQSEVFKQTANYNNARISGEASKEGRSSGVCQLKFKEAQELKSNYKGHQFIQRIPNTDHEFFSFTQGQSQVSNHLQVCGAKMLMAIQKDSMGGNKKPIQNLFPGVNFSQVKAKLQSLKMCQK